jgi:hypothetical protein
MSALPGILKELQQQFDSQPQLTAQKILDEYLSFYNAGQVQEQLWELTYPDSYRDRHQRTAGYSNRNGSAQPSLLLRIQ